jgi:hypothetical protein
MFGFGRGVFDLSLRVFFFGWLVVILFYSYYYSLRLKPTFYNVMCFSFHYSNYSYHL